MFCIKFMSVPCLTMSKFKSAFAYRVVENRGNFRFLKKQRPFLTYEKSFASQAVTVRNEKSKEEITEVGKKVTNDPFVKNLFIGKFDTDMLVFPEVLSKEELEELNLMVKPVEKFFFEDVDSKSIDRNAKIPDSVIDKLRELGLFGQLIPAEYGGLDLNATKWGRMSEITSHDGSISVTLGAHQAIGCKGIVLFGNEQQKAQYLPKLATGENIAAFCLTEAGSGSDAASIRTTATLSSDGKHYLLNGEKIWISNGGIANVFTVFAKTEVTNTLGKKEQKMTAFIVERAFGGVTSGKPEDKLGIRGSNTCSLHFENTAVPIENVIGKVGDGFKIAMNILNNGRSTMGAGGAGMLKRLIGRCAEHAISRKQFGRSIKDFELIQLKFARMAVMAYVMESMAYMTAATMDNYEKPDTSIEAAAVKVYASEACWESISEALQILGGLGYMRDYHFERYLRDCRIMMIFEGTNEILRLMIALTGFQHAGNELKEVVRKFKDPLNNVGFVWKKALERIGEKKDNPKLKVQLGKYVHPNLAPSADAMEKRLILFKIQVEEYLKNYREKIVEEQYALKRFADISIDMYAMTAVIARSSRSICIGLPYHDHEVLLAQTFCHEACKRIDQNLKVLQEGKMMNRDLIYSQIAKDIFNKGGYFATHPLIPLQQ